MKKIVFTLLLLNTLCLVNAQSITLQDLVKLVWMKNSDKQDFLNNKGFDYWRTLNLQGSIENIDYAKDRIDNGVLFHYKETLSYLPNVPSGNITYSIYSLEHLLTIKKYVIANYKLQKIENVNWYKKGSVFINFGTIIDDLGIKRYNIGLYHDY
jgi:hypothetical protein